MLPRFLVFFLFFISSGLTTNSLQLTNSEKKEKFGIDVDVWREVNEYLYSNLSNPMINKLRINLNAAVENLKWLNAKYFSDYENLNFYEEIIKRLSCEFESIYNSLKENYYDKEFLLKYKYCLNKIVGNFYWNFSLRINEFREN